MPIPRAFASANSVGQAGSFNRNLPWRKPGENRAAYLSRQKPVAGNSPIPVRTSGADSLPDNPLIALPIAARTLPRPVAGNTRTEALRGRFQELADRWREETEFQSAISALYLHPAYQEIIGLGPDALPLILEDLATTRSDWFWALRAISGENPTPADERGQVSKMIDHWLKWGHERGLL